MFFLRQWARGSGIQGGGKIRNRSGDGFFNLLKIGTGGRRRSGRAGILQEKEVSQGARYPDERRRLTITLDLTMKPSSKLKGLFQQPIAQHLD